MQENSPREFEGGDESVIAPSVLDRIACVRKSGKKSRKWG